MGATRRYFRTEGMPIDYSQLAPGQEISNQTSFLDAESVSRYLDAVGDPSGLCTASDGRPLAPPMSVAALSLRGVVNDLEILGGTLHAGQELEFIEAVLVGDTLTCKATLDQNSVRGEWRFLVVRLEVENSQGRRVMSGKSTIMVPVQGCSSGGVPASE